MSRSSACGLSFILLAGCGQPSAGIASSGGDGGRTVGAPCTPTQESVQSFDGYQPGEVGAEVPSGGVSGAAVCIVYHFQGLTTCPYGQAITGQAPAGAMPCTTPDGMPVAGTVLPQCVDRRASQVVFWSCRCANAQGRTDDGSNYCACPTAMSCGQVISEIGVEEDDSSGAYCLPPNAMYVAGTSCLSTCDPSSNPCP